MRRNAMGWIGGLVVLALAAAEKPDLERVKPVPANEVIPIADFFRPPLFSNPTLNLAGTHFAAIVDTGQDHTALMVGELATMQTKVLRGSSNKDLSSIDWLDDSNLLTSWTDEKLYAGGLYVTNVRDVTQNYAIEDYSVTQLVAVPVKNPMRPLVWVVRNAYDDGKDLGVVELDARKRIGGNKYAIPGTFQDSANRDEVGLNGTWASIARKFAAPSGGVVVDYLANKEGELAFAVTAENGIYTLQRFEGGKWLKCPVDLDDIYPVEAGDAANELIAVGPRQEGKPRALCRLDAVSGKLGEVLVQDPGYDPTTAVVYRAPVSRTVLGVRFSRAMSESTWFDESYRGIQKILDGNFAGKVVQIIGSDRAEKRFLLRTYSDRQPVTYYMLDLANKSVGLVKNSAPWIDEARMRPMNVVRFKARDGHVIEAYLTLPAGASKQSPVPLIVLPHGGPWARDSWGFDSEVQFFASRGYAVVQPNYRGSPGYNWTFPVEDEWAFRKMHADVTDCVRKIVGSGLVDPARVAIVGTSFGGYLAACGAAFEPGLYRCAVTVSGVFDWAQVMREAKYDQYTEAKFGILRRNLGDPRLHAEEFEAISPLRHMDQAKIPFFVAHGKEDNVAEVSESRALIAELKKFHIPYEAMLVGGEGHGMHFLQNEVELYARIELFLAANLKTAVPAAAVP